MAMRECRCGKPAWVMDTRNRDGFVYRRYKCDEGHQFSTQEMFSEDAIEMTRVHRAFRDALRNLREPEAA